MVLVAITGELGRGKTLALTYLAWRNWNRKNKRIFANYKLNNIPYYHIRKVSDLEKMRDGYVVVDEMWVWTDTSFSDRRKREFTKNILRRSRKRNLTYCFTTQTVDQLPDKIRKILDLIAIPTLNRKETHCKLSFYAGGGGLSVGRKRLKELYFRTAPVFRMYDTTEIVDTIQDDIMGEDSTNLAQFPGAPSTLLPRQGSKEE